jgi:hypothetical protein
LFHLASFCSFLVLSIIGPHSIIFHGLTMNKGSVH